MDERPSACVFINHQALFYGLNLDASFGGPNPLRPKQLAVADPAASWAAAGRERAFFAFATNTSPNGRTQ